MNTKERGMTIILVIAFMGVLSLILAAMTGYVFQQAKYGRALYAREQALSIAEAGLEYYRWFLAKTPSAMTTGVGLETPYSYAVKDPEGATIGTANISTTLNYSCGVVQSADIVSEGVPVANPSFARTISARYMKPSVAEYSYIVGENVWAGADRDIRGPYHSNGGIIMDGTNNSKVTSAVSQWWCAASFSSSRCPTASWKPGVWGNGSGYALWSYPEASIDFGAIAVDLASLKGYVQSGGGLYFAPASGNSNDRGYHIVFNAGGTVTVYRVTSTVPVRGYSTQAGWQTEYNIIGNKVLVGTYSIPALCSVVFVEDRVWLEGVVDAKVTIVAATPSDGSTSPDILLNNNITYQSTDGTDGLTAVAERNILLPLTSPDVMTIQGIFIAQSGRYGRNAYTNSGSNAVPSQYSAYVLQSTLTTIGTVVSAQRTGTNWVSGGVIVTGYQTRNDYYDRILAFSPPPFTPAASLDFKIALWREQ